MILETHLPWLREVPSLSVAGFRDIGIDASDRDLRGTQVGSQQRTSSINGALWVCRAPSGNWLNFMKLRSSSASVLGRQQPPTTPGWSPNLTWHNALCRYVWSMATTIRFGLWEGPLGKAKSTSSQFFSSWDALALVSANIGLGNPISCKQSFLSWGAFKFWPNWIASSRLPPANAKVNAALETKRSSVSLHFGLGPKEDRPRSALFKRRMLCTMMPCRKGLASNLPDTAACAIFRLSSSNSWSCGSSGPLQKKLPWKYSQCNLHF